MTRPMTAAQCFDHLSPKEHTKVAKVLAAVRQVRNNLFPMGVNTPTTLPKERGVRVQNA